MIGRSQPQAGVNLLPHENPKPSREQRCPQRPKPGRADGHHDTQIPPPVKSGPTWTRRAKLGLGVPPGMRWEAVRRRTGPQRTVTTPEVTKNTLVQHRPELLAAPAAPSRLPQQLQPRYTGLIRNRGPSTTRKLPPHTCVLSHKTPGRCLWAAEGEVLGSLPTHPDRS